MHTPEQLAEQLASIDGRDHGAYQSLRGWTVRYDGFTAELAAVPKDPYAPPGSGVVRVRRRADDVGLTAQDLDTEAHRTATRDLLCRRFHAAADRLCGGRRRTGWSGVITVGEPGQAVLRRSSVVLDHDDGGAPVVELRVFVGLPSRGRKVDAGLARTMLLDELPAIVGDALDLTGDRSDLDGHQATVDDARALRSQLEDHGLVAFLADGAVLPRASGVSDAPLVDGAVPLATPEGLRVTLDTPHGGPVTGLGVPAGITVVVGGGYHGKSTLLDAIATGVHDHVRGDGRERCVTRRSAVPVQAASGRPVTGVDVSTFIDGLPDGRSTTAFTTRDASGSTSMAASIVEALELGASVLLVDEDTAANNLLVRDARTQRLVERGDEPITVLRDRVTQLRDELGVSVVLVTGGSGEYLDIADTVLQLTSYRVEDATARAHRIADELPTERWTETPPPLSGPRRRVLVPGSIATRNQHGKRRVRAVARDRILLGEQEVDLRDVVGRLSEDAQTRTLARALERLSDAADGEATVGELVHRLVHELAEHAPGEGDGEGGGDGLDVLDDRRRGRLAEVRALDVAAALNRVRSLEVR